MFVRYLDRKVETLIDPMHEVYVKNNAVKETQNNGCLFRLLDMKKAYDLIEEDILKNNSKRLVEL